jgi:hypothetical protein
LKSKSSVKDFKLPEAKAVAELLFTTEFEENANPAHFLLDNLPGEEAKKFLSGILMSKHLCERDKMQEILNDCVEVLKKENLKNKIEGLKLEIKEAEKLGQTEKAAKLLSVLRSEIS